MTLTKEDKRYAKKSNNSSQKGIALSGETYKMQKGGLAKKTKHESDLGKGSLKQSNESIESYDDTTGTTDKLERKASLRRKFGALLRGKTDIPTVITQTLQPITRSWSVSKDLNRGYEPHKSHLHKFHKNSNAQWYNSLSSLLEDDDTGGHENEDFKTTDTLRETTAARKSITRTTSFTEKNKVSKPIRRVNSISGRSASYGRYSDHYDSSIDLSVPPCEASSLPVLNRSAIDDDDTKSPFRQEKKQQVRNGWEHLRASARSLSFFRKSSSTKHHSVRSRSLTQLDALGSSMLDAGDQLDERNPQQQQSTHHLYHHPQQSPHAYNTESNPRLLVPTASPADSSHPHRARHKLSRSQVSSSEYFSVSFENDDETGSFDREEFLPAIKGTYLAEALGAVCERRGIDLSRVDVMLDCFPTPLPISTTETSCLGGKHLRITMKDEKSIQKPIPQSQRANHNLSFRKTSGNYRCRSGRFFSVSTEDSSVDSEASAATTLATCRSSTGAAGLKASKQRWSGFFTNTKGTKMDLLSALLDEYNKNGVPKLPEKQYHHELALSEEALYSLEHDWRDIVENSDQLTEKQQQQQTALWELAQTELDYIKTLKVLTDLFMACLCGLQSSYTLIDIDRTKLFSNISDIYASNRYFWMEYLLLMINESRDTGQPLDPGYLLPGFETFEQTFSPYTRYCTEQSRCQQYCRDRMTDNELFTVYLAWCETRKDCNRLGLLALLVKPMQRLTKYSLLLKAVHKNTENEDQRADLTQMIKYVDDFVASVNAALKRTEESAKLATAASRIEYYDVVESRDEELDKLIKIHSHLDITTAPIPGCSKDTMRILLREGDLKLRDATTSKMEVHVFLLTDMLLICKASTKKALSSGTSAGGGGLKIVRQPYVVDRIRVHELKEPSSLGLVYLNEYGAASAALVLSAGDPKLAKSWMESLRKAQQQFALMKVPPLGNTMNLNMVSRQASTFLGEGDYEIEESEGLPRTPRGSSRASRVSSLAHSHSGSMEMEGVSLGASNFLPSYNQSKNVSVETTEPPRASSVSSEESGEIGSGHNHRAIQIRRSLLSKSPTPNTLSVQVPAYSSLGQSLPNLTLATSPQTSTVTPTPPNSLLIVPQITKSKETLLSPGHRGISYPPPSPPRGALRRALAIPQSRNPPLIKTRHVNTTVTQTIQSTVSLDADAIEERRRRLEPSQRMPSTTSNAGEKGHWCFSMTTSVVMCDIRMDEQLIYVMRAATKTERARNHLSFDAIHSKIVQQSLSKRLTL